MGFNQGNDLKKVTGGRKRPYRKPRKREIGGYPVETKLSDKEMRIVERVYGGNVKVRLKYATFANVYNPKTKQYLKARILGVVETPANSELARRGIIIKGAIIATELGKAKVVSRPSQEGIVNAILIEEQKPSK
jgi:small subunit ribosomal protein S8e